MGKTRDPIDSMAWRRLRIACFERDKAKRAPCHICRGALGPIDYEAKPSSHGLAYEPDHLLPRATHPELALVPDNIGAAHKTCNRSKGARATANPLGRPSRDW